MPSTAEQPENDASMRGIVVHPPAQIAGHSYQIPGGVDLDPQELRKNVLFFDKLDWPDNNLIGLGTSGDVDFLINCGVLQRTFIQVRGRVELAEGAKQAHFAAFRHLDQQQPGCWSMSTGPRSISFPGSELEADKAALVTLYNAVPVPDRNVPLAEILEFKLRRIDELLALRHHLERIYQRIVMAGDGPLAIRTEMESLQLSLVDHLRTAQESRFAWRLSDFSAGLNLVPVVAGALTAFATGMPLINGILSGSLAGLSIELSKGLKNRTAVATPFSYVSAYHNEVF